LPTIALLFFGHGDFGFDQLLDVHQFVLLFYVELEQLLLFVELEFTTFPDFIQESLLFVDSMGLPDSFEVILEDSALLQRARKLIVAENRKIPLLQLLGRFIFHKEVSEVTMSI
jgi:hypothetical protein